MLGTCAQGSASRSSLDGGKYYPTPIFLIYILTHTRDQQVRQAPTSSVNRAREPAWRQDAPARTVTQAVRTSRAPGAMPHTPTSARQARATQADKQSSQWPLGIFYFFSHKQ